MGEPTIDGGLVPDVALDRTSPIPLYFQVATRLQQLIEDGVMPVGGRLENEVELADRLGVSRPTMRRAIQYLVERGMLVRKRGVGTQIVHPKVRRPDITLAQELLGWEPEVDFAAGLRRTLAASDLVPTAS